MKKITRFLLIALLPVAAGVVFITSCNETLGTETVKPLTKAEAAVSDKATQELLVDILKFQKQVLAGLDKLTVAEKEKFHELVVDFQKANDDDSRNQVMESLGNLVNVDFNAANLRFASHAPKVKKIFEGIPEREIIIAMNNFLMSPRKSSQIPLTKTETEMSADELRALIDSVTPETCNAPETRANWGKCICIVGCTSVAIMALGGCEAASLGVGTPVCIAGVSAALIGCLAFCEALNEK